MVKRSEHAMGWSLLMMTILGGALCFLYWAGGEVANAQPSGTIPKEYQDKHMPKGWWADPKVIAEGKKIFEGMVNPEVVCAACHGRDGKPLLAGTRDLRDAAYMNKLSDSQMFWRINEGVPMTAMTPWKGKLTEEQMWQVIAYCHSFSHGRKPEAHDH